MKKKGFISAEYKFHVEFYDVDTMRVVWHGNYVKFMEAARCVLLDKIGYNYNEMEDDGYLFPVTSINVKYVRSLIFGETATMKAYLVEYENYLKIKYEIFNEKGVLCTKCESSQMAVRIDNGESQFACPKKFIELVEKAIKSEGKDD